MPAENWNFEDFFSSKLNFFCWWTICLEFVREKHLLFHYWHSSLCTLNKSNYFIGFKFQQLVYLKLADLQNFKMFPLPFCSLLFPFYGMFNFYKQFFLNSAKYFNIQNNNKYFWTNCSYKKTYRLNSMGYKWWYDKWIYLS